MKLNYRECCVVVLITRDTSVCIGATKKVEVKRNNLVLLFCDNQNIDIPGMDMRFVSYISKDDISNYLHFLRKDFTQAGRADNYTNYLIEPCRTPDIFTEAARLSKRQNLDEVERSRRNSLIFTVLSIFLKRGNFLPLLTHVTSNDLKSRVSSIVQGDIARNWELNIIASELYMSVSTLKKRLHDEGTSYSEIIKDCRMKHAAEQLLIFHKSIVQTSITCGYTSTSYFTTVFKKYYGVTPLNFIKKHLPHELTL